jgi:hypothetical protein
MTAFKGSKPMPKGRNGNARGGWPDISKVPGNGDVVKPYDPCRHPGSAAQAADDVEAAFKGMGHAKQRGSREQMAGKIPME